MTSILPLIARRILVSVVILFIVSALLFCILRLLPVDPAAMSMPPNATLAEIEAKRREMGLDQPLFRQYLIWLSQVLHGDFGASIHFRRGVAGLIASTLPATIELALLAMLIAGALGIAGGLWMFHVRGTRREPFADTASIVLLSLPEFLWGLFFILLFGVALGRMNRTKDARNGEVDLAQEFHPAALARGVPEAAQEGLVAAM